MTRAVIKLSSDISSAMPRLSKLIEGCAYNPEANLLAFRFKNMVVNVESRQITSVISRMKHSKTTHGLAFEFTKWQ